MNMNQVDDIILNGPAPKKKKGKGLLVVFFLLFLVLILLCGAYWYYINYMQETPKTAFFKYVGQNNFNNVLDTEIYYTMLGKMNEQSYNTETTANFTTTEENDIAQNIDVSKLEFILNSTTDKENEASVFDAKINYSSNDVFSAKLISTKDNIGIGSSEILDKYVATSKVEYSNSMRRTAGVETDISTDTIDEKINEFSSNKINLEEEYKTQKVTEYSNFIYNSIPEEAITENENVVVTIDSKTINTKAYTLSLDANKYKEVLSNVLTKLSEDKELINKLVTGQEQENAEITNENQGQGSTTINPLTNVKVEYTEGETEQYQTAAEVQTDNTEQLEMVTDLPDENLVRQENIVAEDVTAEVSTELGETVDNETKLFENLISILVLNQKVNCTAEDLINDINQELVHIDNITEGIKITVYVRNEEEQASETIKLVMELPSKTSIDVEYQTENKTKTTYLTGTNGVSVEIQRTASDVKTKYNIQFNEIENKKVIAKTQIELETEGSKTSKEYTNEAIIKYNDSENDIKININNKINFNDVKIEETLNDENAIFIDRLSDEEANTLYTQIVEKIMTVYAEKLINLNFIDNNSSSSVVQQPVIEDAGPSKDEVREKLITTVSNMMGQAQQSGTEFTIQNLKDLKIEGLNVSSIVTEELATIKINGYTFKIDKNFMLTEE